MYGSDDDCDLDRLLQIDEEMMTENKPAKVVTPPQGPTVKRTLEDTCNLHSRDGISTAGVKRRKSVFVQNNNQTLEPPHPLMDTCQPPPDRSVLHKRIPLGDYVSVTFSHGKRFYLEVSEQDTDVSITLLHFESTDLAEAAKGLLRQRIEKPSQNIQYVEHTRTNSSALWAAKYAPANYVDLISDEVK
ncbi:hypothetical protein FGIG_11304 [Fasciola gigantica]|uniref:Uncharacterized protein n=1 Tax=Fasciola gigantica TaxID=46835 RepID=A0A504WT15_FASGI|nr:hypothetical protein FGIG_11304 [Fasciola gigantica]